MTYSDDLTVHLKSSDDEGTIYCPVEKDFVDWDTYTGDDQPASDYCVECGMLLEVAKLDTMHHVEIGSEWFCRGEVCELRQISHGYYEQPDYKCGNCGEGVF